MGERPNELAKWDVKVDRLIPDNRARESMV